MILSSENNPSELRKHGRPAVVAAVRVILAGLSLVWFAFGAYAVFWREQINWGDLPIAVWMTVLLFANAAALGAAAWLVGYRSRWGYRYVLALTAANVLVIIFDQVGWVDVLMVLPVIGVLILLVWKRRAFRADEV